MVSESLPLKMAGVQDKAPAARALCLDRLVGVAFTLLHPEINTWRWLLDDDPKSEFRAIPSSPWQDEPAHATRLVKAIQSRPMFSAEHQTRPTTTADGDAH